MRGKEACDMETILDIISIVLPVIIAGAIAAFVINQLKGKQTRGRLGKQATAQAQTLLDSLSPLGMIFRSAFVVLGGMIFPIALPTAIALGASFGLLGGYFAYEGYSKSAERQS